MGLAWSQLYPPTATLTEKNVPSQKGKVFIVTGGYSGVGQQLAQILYGAGGTVYIAGRSQEKANVAIDHIKKSTNTTNVKDGKLEFLPVDLSDFTTIAPAAKEFGTKETKVDVLFNNAAVSLVPEGTKSAQGHELTMATNALGPLLFTLLLMPYLKAAASTSTPGTTRVVWSSSQVCDFAPKGGMLMSEILNPPQKSHIRYMNSKTANWFYASEFGKRMGVQNGILSVTQNPGGLRTAILRNSSILQKTMYPFLWPAVYGAYTELWCGLAEELNIEEHSGGYVLPWGRLHPSPRQDVLDAMKGKEEDGGTGLASEFWDWSEKQIEEYK